MCVCAHLSRGLRRVWGEMTLDAWNLAVYLKFLVALSYLRFSLLFDHEDTSKIENMTLVTKKILTLK